MTIPERNHTNHNTYQHELPDPEYCPDSASHEHEFVNAIEDGDIVGSICEWCGVIES